MGRRLYELDRHRLELIQKWKSDNMFFYGHMSQAEKDIVEAVDRGDRPWAYYSAMERITLNTVRDKWIRYRKHWDSLSDKI